MTFDFRSSSTRPPPPSPSSPPQRVLVTSNLQVTGQKHELFLTAEMKLTLMSRPEERSPKQLAQVLLSLQSIDAFCDYPLHTQQTVARLAFYERCGAKRVVIRQGHHPQHVYIILSGQGE